MDYAHLDATAASPRCQNAQITESDIEWGQLRKWVSARG